MSEKQETYNELRDTVMDRLHDLTLPLHSDEGYKRGLERAYSEARYIFEKYEEENNLEPTPTKKAWLNRPQD